MIHLESSTKSWIYGDINETWAAGSERAKKKEKKERKVKYINSTFHFDQVSLDSAGIWLRVSWLGKCCFGVSGIYSESHRHFLWRHVYANVLHYSQGYNSPTHLLLWYHRVETENSYILVLSRENRKNRMWKVQDQKLVCKEKRFSIIIYIKI